MESLNQVKNKMLNTFKENEKRIQTLREQAKTIFNEEMKAKSEIVKEMISKLESSNDLTSVNHDEWYHCFIRVDFDKLINIKDELEKELLEDFFSEEYCANCDFENDCLTMAIGPCILINHEGDVLDQDSGKWFISKRDYETTEELNALIEKHMEDSGCFPSVVSVDYHGNAHYVKTQK